MAVRAQRQQLVSSDEPDLDREEARHLPSPEEQLVSFDRLRRSAEALQRLKPPHLRNCTACRATVRELHETSAPLAALFPVALAPAAVGEHKSSLFARIYDAVAGGIHHRAAAAASKVQAATEAAPTGKLAAIAASAAAIGSGAVVAHSRVPSHAAGAAQARPVAQHTAPPLRTAGASAPGRTTTTA